MEEETDDHSGRSYVHCRDRKSLAPQSDSESACNLLHRSKSGRGVLRLFSRSNMNMFKLEASEQGRGC